MNDLLKTPLIMASFALLIGALSFINGCIGDKSCNAKDSNSGIIISSYKFGCEYFDKLLIEKQFVIDNERLFQNLLSKSSDSPARTKCDAEHFPQINFLQHTLLGLYAEGGGCSLGFKKEVTKDDVNKLYRYNIKVDECGGCDSLGYGMFWVLVPKLPKDYKVEFEVK